MNKKPQQQYSEGKGKKEKLLWPRGPWPLPDEYGEQIKYLGTWITSEYDEGAKNISIRSAIALTKMQKLSNIWKNKQINIYIIQKFSHSTY